MIVQKELKYTGLSSLTQKNYFVTDISKTW